MLEWLAPVVTAGGSAFVGAVASDAWKAARGGLVRLFGQGGARRQELAERWADETAAQIEQASEAEREQVRQRLAPVWVQRLSDLVEEYPELGEGLRAWVEQVRTELPEQRQTWVQTFIARDNAHQYNAPHGSIAVHHGPGGTPAS